MHDASGTAYLDLLAGYSALNFGHRHPALIAAAHAQLDRLTLTSRAFDHDLLDAFADRLAGLLAPLLPADLVLPMNTGAEAVETAIKTARKWGYEVKGVPADRATIVVAEGNFHGRTTTIVSLLLRRGRPAPASGRTRPASGWCPTATRQRWPPPSTRPPSRCCSSRCRARPA